MSVAMAPGPASTLCNEAQAPTGEMAVTPMSVRSVFPHFCFALTAAARRISTNRDLPSIHELDVWCDDDGITVFQSLPHFDADYCSYAANNTESSINNIATTKC